MIITIIFIPFFLNIIVTTIKKNGPSAEIISCRYICYRMCATPSLIYNNNNNNNKLHLKI